ncbi:DUF3892 domain-containing protein [Diaminobutyricibacter tongyongensis]|uniref:DUF3892 domain-containing protein n=1 Tax=Leifsonia tongyongensis TaxID=1268043 RepID=A0A6L9Y2E1_9MICO|nr:DUF3892 domain-containing protein [Diaminobutyricibacter tongyongensis]NEN07849.1 DUF3892 domain-containing protein [Diaminobutyricibacter tongyongensis]
MATRAVTHTRKDQAGNIIGLGKPGEYWSVRSSADAISDITAGTHSYYVPWATGSTWIEVVRGHYGPYLRTDADNTTRNNLDDLPNI